LPPSSAKSTPSVSPPPTPCAPSSVSLAFKGGARLYDLGTRGIKRFLGDHLWHSPFVNRTHDGIVAKFHLPTKKEKS
jgi:hypothetical protein